MVFLGTVRYCMVLFRIAMICAICPTDLDLVFKGRHLGAPFSCSPALNLICWLMTKFWTSLQQMSKYILKRSTNLISRNVANLKLRNMRASHSRFSSQTEQTLSTVILANIKLISVRKLIQVIDSIPWVRCASGIVFLMPPLTIDLWLGDQSQF